MQVEVVNRIEGRNVEAHSIEDVGYTPMGSFGKESVPPVLGRYAEVIQNSGTDLLHGRDYGADS